MKQRRAYFAVVILLLATSLGHAQSVDDVIDKYLSAVGGKTLWRSLNAVKLEGNVNAGGTTINVVVTSENKKGMRQDISMNGMSGYSFFTPTEGWTYMPFAGMKEPEAMTPDDLKAAAPQLDIQGELLDYKDKGSTAELIGKEDVDGTECYKIKLTDKSGTVTSVFIDPSNYYLIRTTTKSKSNGQDVEQTTNFSNFQKTPEGYVFPMTIEAGQGAVNITKITVNPKIDPSTFKKS